MAGPSVADGSAELQAAFQRFMKRKKKLRRKAIDDGKKYAKQRGTAAFRAKLRARFLERIRHYIGVPYAKRYHNPEHCTCEGCTESGRQLYHDPLALDCCALIRRVVSDLRQFFGFKLGRWNQSYQFDCLPLRVASVSELQPGDLIFWSGEYFNPKSRRQVFDMTHVEVFVGGASGKGTIGSRQQHKWVMEYDSYEFVSKSWRCKEVFFCKLDTWLDGVLRPEHPELWRGSGRTEASLRKSVFHVEEEEQQAGTEPRRGLRVVGEGGGEVAVDEEDYELEGVAGSDSDVDSDASKDEAADEVVEDGQDEVDERT